MTLKMQFLSTLSSTSAGDKDLGNLPLTTETTSDMNEGSSRLYRVPNDTENQEVDLAGLAEVNYVVIKSDKDVTLRLNGTESIPVTVPKDFAFGWLILTTSGITSMDVSNSSGDTAKVLVQLGGDT